MPNRKSITNILGLAGQRNLMMRQCKNCCHIYLAVNNIPVLHKKVGQIARENSFESPCTFFETWGRRNKLLPAEPCS